MKKIDQTQFGPPGIDATDPHQPLIVHRHSGVDNRNLVVFVHGLNGDRYGTWGNFPKFLFDDCPHVDVGAYSYRSGFKRLFSKESVSLSTEARIFADDLRDDSQYERIILIGHSMGGLLARSVVKRLQETGQGVALARVKALILMASPQAGSQRGVPGADKLLTDAEVLKAHGPFVTEIDEVFKSHIDNSPEAVSPDKVHLPVWAVIGAADKWVDPLSAALGLPAGQTKTVHGGHTDIVKPETREDDCYQYTLGLINRRCPPPSVEEEPDDLPADAPALPNTPHSLPFLSLGSLFKGRGQALKELRVSLSGAGTPHATVVAGKAIHGLGGVGKTRLAVEYGWQHLADYSAVLFVTADSPDSLQQNLAGLGCVLTPDAEPLDNEAE